MRQTQKLKDLHGDLISEFDRVWEAQREERAQALEDRRFYSISGAQYEGALGQMFENRPKIEINKVHLAVIRLINEYRNNRISVDFLSKDGSDNQDMSETCDQLFRADEQDSCAEEAKDNAFEEQVGGGMGAVRLRTCYEDEGDEENEAQRIKIEPIVDADQCVFFDLDAKRQDKSDARRCWVLTGMTPEAFKAEWGKDGISIDRKTDYTFDWFTPDTVYAAEVYEVEDVKKVIDTWQSPVGDETRKVYAEEYEDDPELRQMLEDTGWQMIKTRKIKEKRVRKYIMDGQEILEDCGYIAGTEIPIAVGYGKRWFVDGIERFMGHVRLAKDPQRLKNVQMSQLAYIAAISPIEVPIFMAEQIAGHEERWANAHIDNSPFMVINALRDPNGALEAAQPISYTKPPTLSSALAALLQTTEQDMADILGNQQQGEKMEANQSGKAVELIQTRLDMQAFIYLSNHAKMVKRMGEIWLSMAKDVYIEKGRKLKGVTKQGAVESIELYKPELKDGQSVLTNDLSKASFDVAVDVGPSSESRRAAAVKALTGLAMITTDEATRRILVLSSLSDIEAEGISELREWARRQLVVMGVYEPTEEDQKRMAEEKAGQEPDANTKYLLAAAEKEQMQTKKLGAEVVKTMNQSAQIEADTLKTLQEVDMTEGQAAMAQMNSPAMGSAEPAPLNVEQGSMNAQ